MAKLDDIEQIRLEFERRDAKTQAVIASLQNTNASLQELLKQKEDEIERLNQIIRNLLRSTYGQKSEKSVYVCDTQKSLFDTPNQTIETDSAETESAPPTTKEDNETVVTEHTRKRKRSIQEKYANLPVEKRIIGLPDEKMLGDNGKPLACIGEEYLRTEIIVEEARYYRVEYYRQIYVDNSQEPVTGESIIIKPEVPAPLIEHSFASPSIATQVIINKYFSGLPLYRQEQIYKQQGVNLSRATMANWLIAISERYGSKLWQRFSEILLASRIIHADETPIQVLKEPNRMPTQQSRMWVYTTPKRSQCQIRCFEYKDSRSGSCAAEFLKGFNGILISDAYSGYQKVPHVIRAGCWAHMRRKWFEAMPKNATPENSLAAKGFDYCNRLFELEKSFEQLTDELRFEQRRIHSRKLLDEYWLWIESIPGATGKLKDAITYAHRQKEYLEAFIKHGEIEISNNQVENAIRPFVVGRKGWLFADTQAGAQASAVLYSIVETAKANHLNVDSWLTHVLTVLPQRLVKNKDSDIDDLLPWADEMQSLFFMK